MLDQDVRRAAERVFDALLGYVGTFTQAAWDAISTAEDALIEVIKTQNFPGRDSISDMMRRRAQSSMAAGMKQRCERPSSPRRRQTQLRRAVIRWTGRPSRQRMT
ncbi:hypothetical protein [Mycobacterium shottsii]|uniref:hypothetical protein n=1 Tax=Mycobacterium shottsii TaxID=133549 RepID=UPI0018E97D53|nr:hypothetical protein [Mycobacterium shottsii]